jgi:hypothetical protein
VDKNEFIQNFQDGLRQAEATQLAKTVVSCEADFGAKLSATVSPCSYVTVGHPFQITVQMVSGGKTIVQDPGLRYETATVDDMRRLLDSVSVQQCARPGCSRPAFGPGQFKSNRAGRCETCFITALNAEFAQATAQEAVKNKAGTTKADKEHKAVGFTHRVNASIHACGDDVEATIYMVDATDEKAKAELIKQTGCNAIDFVITLL